MRIHRLCPFTFSNRLHSSFATVFSHHCLNSLLKFTLRLTLEFIPESVSCMCLTRTAHWRRRFANRATLLPPPFWLNPACTFTVQSFTVLVLRPSPRCVTRPVDGFLRFPPFFLSLYSLHNNSIKYQKPQRPKN